MYFPHCVSRIKYSGYDIRYCAKNSVGRGLYKEIVYVLKISLNIAFQLHHGISVTENGTSK